MAAATYRIGPSDFFTPGDLAADADTLNAQVTQLDGALQAGASPDLLDSWEAWRAGWQSFYSDHFGGFLNNFTTALNDSNRDALVSYENQFSYWRDQAQSQGKTVYAPDIAPSTGSGDSLSKQLAAAGLPSLTEIIVGAIVGIILLEVMK